MPTGRIDGNRLVRSSLSAACGKYARNDKHVGPIEVCLRNSSRIEKLVFEMEPTALVVFTWRCHTLFGQPTLILTTINNYYSEYFKANERNSTG